MSPYVSDQSDIVQMTKDLAWCSDPMNVAERNLALEFAGYTKDQIARLGEQAGRNAEAERKLRLARAM